MDNIFISPASESLFYDPGSIWPDEITKSQELKSMIVHRLRLVDNLDYLLNLLAGPGLSLGRLMGGFDYELDRIVMLYNDLSVFICESEVNRRLILYLPFEIIPELGIVGANSFKEAVTSFQIVYLEAWFKLLFKSEFRANFSNGDIWEEELGRGKSEMICKAAHLIPMLLQKRLVSLVQINDLLSEVSSSRLKGSIIEALKAAAELGIISDHQSESLTLSDLNYLLVDNQKDLFLLMTEAVEMCLKNKEDLVKRWSQILPSRIVWEEEFNRQDIIKKYAAVISNSLISNSLSPAVFAKQIKNISDLYFILLAIYSLQLTVEKLDRYKQARASLIADYFKFWLLRMQKDDSVEIKKAIESTILRWFNAGIIDSNYLLAFDLRPVNLDGGVSVDKICSPVEIEELNASVALIQKSPELSAFFYPVVLIYGSRVKGYGSKYADIDLAVFVRPEIDYNRQGEEVTSMLKQVFKQEKIEGKVLQFWLVNDNDYLSVKDNIDGNHRFVAKNFYAHVLFDGAWFGSVDAIKELHAKLLGPYLFFKDIKFMEICLRELERYNLQYRLLHKGYANFFPEQGGLNTKWIDADSVFYDRGYRCLASKIFIKKIFLPKLSI